MDKVKQRESRPEATFTLDVEFVRKEAKEALKSYFLPFSGLYAAVTGRDVVFVRRDKNGRIMRNRAPQKKQA